MKTKQIKLVGANGSVIEGRNIGKAGVRGNRSECICAAITLEWRETLFNVINKDVELKQLILSAFVASSRPSLAAEYLTKAREILSKKYDIEMEILT